jgi:hypothetical protein
MLAGVLPVATAMGFLPPEEQAVVDRARALGLGGTGPDPAYLCPNLCTALSLLLAVPSLGFSLLLVPILWVAQHEHTGERIRRLRRELAGCIGEGNSGLAMSETSDLQPLPITEPAHRPGSRERP